MLSEQEIFRQVYEKKITRQDALKLLEQLNTQNKEQAQNDQGASQAEVISSNTLAVQNEIKAIVCEILHVTESELDFKLNFKDMGVDSISGIEIVRNINTKYDINLDASVLYDYVNIGLLSSHVKELLIQDAECCAIPVNADIYHDSYYQELRKEYNSGAVKQNSPSPDNQSNIPLNPKHSQQVHSEPSCIVVPSEKDGLEEIEKTVSKIVRGILHLDISEVGKDTAFKDMGIDSISGIEIVREINKIYGLNMDAVILYDYPSILKIARYIYDDSDIATASVKADQNGDKIYHDEYFQKLRQEYIQDTSKTSSMEINEGRQKKSLKPLCSKINEEDPVRFQSKVALRETKQAYIDMTLPTASTKIGDNSSSQYHDKRTEDGLGIAVIGMSGTFAKAKNLEEYWNNLKNGVDCITEISKERWNISDFYNSNIHVPNCTCSKWQGMVPDIDEFDPAFFNISPAEAEIMDPQQRVFLEQAWKALENAGIPDKKLSDSRCGVFVGAAHGDYDSIVEKAEIKNASDVFTGMSASILPARISYFLNLKGPAVAVDTACSSSLVAIHEACKSLLLDETDIAIAGGVRLMITPRLHIQASAAGMMSPTGKCRAFDNLADGIVLGEGAGAIILKKLCDAKKDGDHIYGVIVSSGVNQDGNTNGITAPSAKSQATLEAEVYAKGGINPENITFIETHGTGTKLGDPIEIRALQETFAKFTDKKGYCALGSVKANIGHATMAAGVASVIKVLLAMKHKVIPPQINYEKLNEHITLDNSPFYISSEPVEWHAQNGKPLMAAVSSFGFSGTNVHMVIREP